MNDEPIITQPQEETQQMNYWMIEVDNPMPGRPCRAVVSAEDITEAVALFDNAYGFNGMAVTCAILTRFEDAEILCVEYPRNEE